MCTKKNLLIVILVTGILLANVHVSYAATEAEKQVAIDAGLAWLATQQQSDGRWRYGGGDDNFVDIAVTGSALLAFIEEGNTLTSGAYSTNVTNGLAFLMNYAQTYSIAPQPAGDPDSNGNGIGVKFSPVVGNNGRDIYQTGLAIIPIAALNPPGSVPAGPQAGRSYAAVIQDVVDYFAFAQNDNTTGGNRGGWRYYANEGTSDNSTSQWPTVGLLYAQSAGATVPAFVWTELAFWAVAITNADGGSLYDLYNNVPGSNVSRTGTLLSQKHICGLGIASALAYLNNQWNTSANAVWNGNWGHPYAMWAAYKGLELTIGLDDETTITNVRDQSTVRGGGPAPLDNPDHGWNWWEDYCEYLVTTQAGGTWPGYDSWTGPLATAWYINILAATEIPSTIEVEIDIKPGSYPSSVNLKNKGVTPVAIHTTEDFDATEVDPMSVVLGECAIPVKAEHYDCDEIPNPDYDPILNPDVPEMIGDGDIDLVLYFVTKDLECLGNVTEATLTGETYGGQDIEGTGDIRFVTQGRP